MGTRKKSDRVAEYGDFQTPVPLARAVCQLLSRRGVKPTSIIEPTCGIGNFLVAAVEQFGKAKKAVGLEINPAYVNAARERFHGHSQAPKVEVIEGSFFSTEWSTLLAGLPDPLLVVGNPPWVTNSELGALGSLNLPRKTNFKNHAGLEALTGKSNFDISEWMLLQFLDWLDGRNATMAILCKTAVARKILAHAWQHDVSVSRSAMYKIDANASFGASVDACLFVCDFSRSTGALETPVYRGISDIEALNVIGYRDGRLIADVGAYERWKHLIGGGTYCWRSGIKHDCAKVMELLKEGNRYRNGFDEIVDLEDRCLYPMLKSSEIANGRTRSPKRWMLVTQTQIGETTAVIKERAPKTWKYLQSHADRLNRRASSIYRKRPPFSIFGVGDYSFAPWKVAISGLYKKLRFATTGSVSGKPIVLDDTCYFVPCRTKAEAKAVADLLNSRVAQEFFSAFIFWDAKRPVTIEVLQRLNIAALAHELGSEDALPEYVDGISHAVGESQVSRETQLGLFDAG